MSEIEVKLLGNLKYYPEQKKRVHNLEVDEAEELTLLKIINKLNLPRQEINLILVNDQARDLNYKVKKGDKIKILPVIAGGI